MTQDQVAVNDPDLADAPQMVALDWFLAAWQAQQSGTPSWKGADKTFLDTYLERIAAQVDANG